MELTRVEAIQKHREMWNWIADEIGKTGKIKTKDDYLNKFYPNTELFRRCFLCDYVEKEHKGDCRECPLIFSKAGSEECSCINIDSPYMSFLKAISWGYWGSENSFSVDKARISARVIANLLEKRV